MKLITHSPQETEHFGEQLGKRLIGNEVLALRGGMGMGKTALVRGIARGVGSKSEVSSPTFALVHEYTDGKIPLYHFDMYRVASWDDLYSTGFFDYLETGVLVIEWSENIEEALPPQTVFITLEMGEQETERIIRISDGGVAP